MTTKDIIDEVEKKARKTRWIFLVATFMVLIVGASEQLMGNELWTANNTHVYLNDSELFMRTNQTNQTVWIDANHSMYYNGSEVCTAMNGLCMANGSVGDLQMVTDNGADTTNAIIITQPYDSDDKPVLSLTREFWPGDTRTSNLWQVKYSLSSAPYFNLIDVHINSNGDLVTNRNINVSQVVNTNVLMTKQITATYNSTQGIQMTADDATPILTVDAVNDRVGIGDTLRGVSPEHTLEVDGNISANDYEANNSVTMVLKPTDSPVPVDGQSAILFFNASQLIGIHPKVYSPTQASLYQQGNLFNLEVNDMTGDDGIFQFGVFGNFYATSVMASSITDNGFETCTSDNGLCATTGFFGTGSTPVTTDAVSNTNMHAGIITTDGSGYGQFIFREAYTSASTYTCTYNDVTTPSKNNVITFTKTDGNYIEINNAASGDDINIICFGN
jgi:hypothetical protein